VWVKACRDGRSVFLPLVGKKGKSHMDSSQVVPWYNRPARPFPALVWLGQQYPFLISSSAFARPAGNATQQRREFPAKVWMQRRQVG
jgi:hypothetical protein